MARTLAALAATEAAATSSGGGSDDGGSDDRGSDDRGSDKRCMAASRACLCGGMLVCGPARRDSLKDEEQPDLGCDRTTSSGSGTAMSG